MFQTPKNFQAGEIYDPSDKRIKRCAYCNKLYRDKTRPNNSKTCSKRCKTDLDTARRRKRRAAEAILKPKKPTKREKYYMSHYEYPFWASDEYEMLKQSWKYEMPYAPDKIAQIAAAKERYELMGGRRTPKRVVPYHGDERDDF